MLGMLCTLDIEASGFGRNGYPIEVGYVRDDGQAWCTLIRPQPDWTHWDPAAEQLHGISRQALERHGRAPGAVCKRLNDALAGRIVESMKQRGILLSTDGPDHNVIKIKPPLVFSRENVDLVCENLDEAIG